MGCAAPTRPRCWLKTPAGRLGCPNEINVLGCAIGGRQGPGAYWRATSPRFPPGAHQRPRLGLATALLRAYPPRMRRGAYILTLTAIWLPTWSVPSGGSRIRADPAVFHDILPAFQRNADPYGLSEAAHDPEPPARGSPRRLAIGIDVSEIDGPVWSVSYRGTARPFRSSSRKPSHSRGPRRY